MKTLTLNNGQTIPMLGFGTWRLSNDNAATLVEAAIKSGYRHIDCAMIYGNEKEVGDGIKRAIDKGIVKREDLFITSKLWNTDHAPEHVAEACRQTLNDLKLEYLDLYLVHWNVGFEYGEDKEPLDANGLAKFSYIPLQATWQAMEKLVDEGLTKSIGVANQTAPMLVDLLSYAKIKPVMNQIEIHPYHTQSDLLKFCRSQKITVTAYSPFGSMDAPVLADSVIQAIGSNYKRTPAQVVLRWNMQRGVAAIPKSSTESRINENFDIEGFELSENDMKAIEALDRKKIFVNPIEWWGFPYF